MQSFFFRTSGQDNVQLFSQQQLDRLNVQLQQVDEDTAHERSPPRHLRNEMETGAEMRPAMCFGIVTGDASVSYGAFFFPVPSNSP